MPLPYLRPRFLARIVAGALAVTASASARQPLSSEAPPALASARPGAVLTLDDDALLDEIERGAFRFFREQTNPVTGLVRDRARADGAPSEGKASIAAEGFALAAWAIASNRGWVDRSVAVTRVRLMLRFLATKAPRVHGFFYHFMEMDTGARAWQCELSSIDTGFFLAGAIIAREYFRDPEITELVDQLYRETDWTWFLNGGSTIAMGWHPEGGFSRYRWGFYAEHMMMSFLGMGAPRSALSRDYWQTWKREPVGTYAGYHFIEGPPLFIHQFAHAFVDFRDLRDAFADYYHNSVLATLAQRQFCVDLRTEFPTWSERLWGVTASDSADGYKAWGGPPRTAAFNALDGTIVPCATAGSVPFAPYETLMVLHHIRTVYGSRTWKRYGFVDAFNPETGWIDTDVIGIDQGISLLQAENARTGFLWALFMQAPEVKRALARSGFVSESRSFSWTEREKFRTFAGQAWQSLDPAPPLPDTLGLRLTAVCAAEVLGLIDGTVALQRARLLLDSAVPPQTDVAVAEYAAGLVTLRQAIPSLADEATQLLDKIDWNRVTPSSTKLGSASRLAVFFRIAAGKTPATAWAGLVRSPEKRGAVYVLSPADVNDQLLPGLWLNERPIISGASAEQLAYSLAVAPPDEDAAPPPPLDVPTVALLLDHFPAELLGRFEAAPPAAGWIENAPPEDRAALLITIANLLVPDCIREWFQDDSLVQSARRAIPEFGAAAFGKKSSIYQRYELAGPFVPPPERHALAVTTGTPADQWPWTKFSGLEFKDSPADVRPDDPMIELRFAFTWDATALHFHAEAMDTPAGYKRPAGGKEQVELLIDPKSDGFVWGGPEDFHFVFRPAGASGEVFDLNHPHAVPAKFERTPHGYNVDADIPWSVLGLTPKSGLEFGITTAIASNGRYEWEPSLKLNWRFFQRRDERYGLGTLRLE